MPEESGKSANRFYPSLDDARAEKLIQSLHLKIVRRCPRMVDKRLKRRIALLDQGQALQDFGNVAHNGKV